MSAIGANLKPPLPKRATYLKWAQKQMGLLLGDSGQSYVVGYGKKYPLRCHHRARYLTKFFATS